MKITSPSPQQDPNEVDKSIVKFISCTINQVFSTWFFHSPLVFSRSRRFDLDAWTSWCSVAAKTWNSLRPPGARTRVGCYFSILFYRFLGLLYIFINSIYVYYIYIECYVSFIDGIYMILYMYFNFTVHIHIYNTIIYILISNNSNENGRFDDYLEVQFP